MTDRPNDIEGRHARKGPGCLGGLALLLLALVVVEATWSGLNYVNRPLFHSQFYMHEGDWVFRWWPDLWVDPQTGDYAVADVPLRIMVVVACDPTKRSAHRSWLPQTTSHGAHFVLPSGKTADIPPTPDRLYLLHSDGRIESTALDQRGFTAMVDWMWSHNGGQVDYAKGLLQTPLMKSAPREAAKGHP